ncbi:hypothetical protein AB1Y20_018055 [Prymnesium parvum]|uniref:Uncharacterized protein n=1 Tax=Prymnesium parvum TaxID=97485 RepID=A0AB34JR33_PRYPA
MTSRGFPRQRSRSSVSQARSAGVNELTPWWNVAGGPRSFQCTRTPSSNQDSTRRGAPMSCQACKLARTLSL